VWAANERARLAIDEKKEFLNLHWPIASVLTAGREGSEDEIRPFHVLLPASPQSVSS
jgi:hypothetical protein